MPVSTPPQTKDDEAAFAIMHQFMTLYNYREIYCPSLTNLQVQNQVESTGLPERASQGEQNGANFSFIAPSSEEL